MIVTRIRTFLRAQRRAFRLLLLGATGPHLDLGPDVLHPPIDEGHPSQRCRCYGGAPPRNALAAAHIDHLPDCGWAAVMCDACTGDGKCSSCGGDGTDPAKYAPDVAAIGGAG